MLLLFILPWLAACAAPGLSHWAAHYHLQQVAIDSKPFALQALLPRPAEVMASDRLHIYIEGDGEPFLNAMTVAPDPTPRNPLMLRLMAKDTAPRAFVTRPCYFGMQADCTPPLWTLARYSPLVVQSLVDAIEILARPHHHVVLIGHSGGGTLATLLAGQIPKVSHVVTLAGNLDTGRWAAHHALTPLSGSLDPMQDAPLPDRVRQIHYVGTRDKNILPQWAESFARRQAHARVIPVDSDHTCCWERQWPTLLDQALDDELHGNPDMAL